MSKYIGTPVVNISADTVDVTGDITTTDATPEVTIVNNTHEDTDGGREGKVTFKGQQSGGEETTLAQIQASHDGTSDDEKGDLIFKTNDGSDGASPTERMRIDSTGATTITTTGNETQLTLTSTDADATTGPNMSLFRNSASPADSDQTGSIFFIGKDDGGNNTTYGAITTHIADASGGTEDGRLTLSSMKAGTSTETLHAVSGKIGINETEPDANLHINATSQGNFTEAMRISNTGGGADEGNYIQWEISNTSGYGPRIGGRRESTGGAGLHFFTGEINGNPTEAMRLTHDGVVVAAKGIQYSDFAENSAVGDGLNITERYSYNDNNANTIGSGYNNHHNVLYIDGGGGITAVPMYPNGGSGVAWQVYMWDVDNQVFRNNQIDFTQAGSSGNTFQIVVSSGGGSATIQRTSGSAAYVVYRSTVSGGTN